ncbi:hypothetical protein K438DRAFT_1979649 [Mycena galopus ATCC 62051]|nr:hypothetical protein K438DRAFT_1979649 [Mycena galopus ATCC 62051]
MSGYGEVVESADAEVQGIAQAPSKLIKGITALPADVTLLSLSTGRRVSRGVAEARDRVATIFNAQLNPPPLFFPPLESGPAPVHEPRRKGLYGGILCVARLHCAISALALQERYSLVAACNDADNPTQATLIHRIALFAPISQNLLRKRLKLLAVVPSSFRTGAARKCLGMQYKHRQQQPVILFPSGAERAQTEILTDHG